MVPDDQTMPALVHLLREYATGGHPFKTLAQALNSKGYTTSHHKAFTESSISTVLNNRFYIGEAVYHRRRPDEEVYQGVHEVPDEVSTLWLRCQDVRSEKRMPGQPSPPLKEQRVIALTGVLICDGCGEPFGDPMNPHERCFADGFQHIVASILHLGFLR